MRLFIVIAVKQRNDTGKENISDTMTMINCGGAMGITIAAKSMFAVLNRRLRCILLIKSPVPVSKNALVSRKFSQCNLVNMRKISVPGENAGRVMRRVTECD